MMMMMMMIIIIIIVIIIIGIYVLQLWLPGCSICSFSDYVIYLIIFYFLGSSMGWVGSKGSQDFKAPD